MAYGSVSDQWNKIYATDPMGMDPNGEQDKSFSNVSGGHAGPGPMFPAIYGLPPKQQQGQPPPGMPMGQQAGLPNPTLQAIRDLQSGRGPIGGGMGGGMPPMGGMPGMGRGFG
jgi:hypothetical protein